MKFGPKYFDKKSASVLIAIVQELANLVHFFRSANYHGAHPLTCRMIVELVNKNCRREQGVGKNFQTTFILKEINCQGKEY